MGGGGGVGVRTSGDVAHSTWPQEPSSAKRIRSGHQYTTLTKITNTLKQATTGGGDASLVGNWRRTRWHWLLPLRSGHDFRKVCDRSHRSLSTAHPPLPGTSRTVDDDDEHRGHKVEEQGPKLLAGRKHHGGPQSSQRLSMVP